MSAPAAVPTAEQLARLVRARELSPVELVEQTLRRIDALQPALHAFLTVAHDAATAAAARAERALAAGEPVGPLHGVPVAVKDLEPTAGIRTTFGSRVYADHVPAQDAIVVERLRRAGAIVVGKTNTPELGLLAETKNLLGEDCRNPWDRTRIVSGSSGGSAAALAAGLVPLATGTDTSGSITSPAAVCGVVGVKPSHGRVPLWPWPADSGLFTDTGPMARTVRDAALMLDLTAGHDARDHGSLRVPAPRLLAALDEPPTGLRVAWTRDCGRFLVEPEIAALAAGAAHALADACGGLLQERDAAIDDPFDDVCTPLYYCDLHVAHAQALAPHWELLHPATQGELRTAAAWATRPDAVTRYVDALRGLRRVGDQVAELLGEADVLACPANPFAAYPIGAPPATIAGTPIAVEEVDWRLMAFTALCNLTGRPAVSVPCGVTAAGLPAGLLLIGRPGEDATVLRAARALELARPWAARRPPDPS